MEEEGRKCSKVEKGTVGPNLMNNINQLGRKYKKDYKDNSRKPTKVQKKILVRKVKSGKTTENQEASSAIVQVYVKKRRYKCLMDTGADDEYISGHERN